MIVKLGVGASNYGFLSLPLTVLSLGAMLLAFALAGHRPAARRFLKVTFLSGLGTAIVLFGLLVSVPRFLWPGSRWPSRYDVLFAGPYGFLIGCAGGLALAFMSSRRAAASVVTERVQISSEPPTEPATGTAGSRPGLAGLSRSQKYRWGIGVVLAGVVFLTGLNGGCASSTLPPKLEAARRATIAQTHFDRSVGVERFMYPVYSDGLTAALRQTQLFTRVDRLEDLSQPPELVARVGRPIYGTAGIPVLAIVSLGVVPSSVSEEHGYAFSLSASADPARRVPVEFSYRGPTTLGWWAVFLNLLPNRTKSDVAMHPRVIDGVAWKIVANREQILELK